MKQVIVVGGGGHAKVLIDSLQLLSCAIIGIVDPILPVGTKVLGVPVLGGDQAILQFSPMDIQLVNGLGSVELPERRIQIYNQFVQQGYQFSSVVHPTAILSSHCVLGNGVQVMAGGTIQPGSHVGDNTIVNTRAAIDHDCMIGEHVHIAPGAILSGSVKIGAGSHIGTGAVIIQGIRIGKRCLIGAGSVVIRDVPDHSFVFGVPAKEAKV